MQEMNERVCMNVCTVYLFAMTSTVALINHH